MAGDDGTKPPAPGWWQDDNGGWHPPAGKVGKAMGPSKGSDNNAGAGCMVLLALGAIFWVIGTCSGGDDASTPDAPSNAAPSAEDLKAGAFDVCTNFVKDRLKAPATAEFRNYYEEDGEVVVTGGPTTYTVASTVDSENGFGAKIRSTFVCEVTHVSGANWRLVDISIV
jgi:hypothetical protein